MSSKNFTGKKSLRKLLGKHKSKRPADFIEDSESSSDDNGFDDENMDDK